MAFNTSDPSPYLLNISPLNNVITSATGTSGTATLNDVLAYFNTGNASLSINEIGTAGSAFLTINNNVNFNAGIYINGINVLTSNSVNGTPYLALQVNTNEIVRCTENGVGIQTVNPVGTLDVNGQSVFRGSIYVSSFGAVAVSTIGNIYADGSVFASGIMYPSDPSLKMNISTYTPHAIPRAVEFLWKQSGTRDIGVLADEVASIEPSCVIRHPNGTLAVDYPKLVVLCLAEIHALKAQVATLKIK